MGIVLDGNKTLLTQQLDRGWEPPGGFIEPRETPLDSCRREVFEETGYEVGTMEPFGTFVTLDPPHVVSIVFISKDCRKKSDSFSESLEVRWVDARVALEMMTYEPTRYRYGASLDAFSRGIMACGSYIRRPFSVMQSGTLSFADHIDGKND